jgi:hypothetical protein
MFNGGPKYGHRTAVQGDVDGEAIELDARGMGGTDFVLHSVDPAHTTELARTV